MEEIRKYIRELLNEVYLSDNETFWAWVSPDNQFFKVPKLKHQGFIMARYKDFSWDYDKVFDKAIQDGWVRVIYEYFPNYFKGELSLNSYDENRIKSVLKDVFGDLIRYGNKSIFIDAENPKVSLRFSTFSSEGKMELMNYLKS
jgi:hypothetical protein